MAGCAIRDNLETPFNNPTNTPVIHDGSGGTGNGDPSQVRYCVPDANGVYDGAKVTAQATLVADSVAQATGGGCVLRPIREVWAVLNNQPEMKWEAADRLVTSRIVNPPKPGFTHLYTDTYYKSSGIPISIHWTIEWYHGIGGGTFEAPTSVNIVFHRTKGTEMMPVWQGGIVLTKVTETVTSVAILDEFRAAQGDDQNKNDSLDELNELIRHMRNGPPDWTNLNTGFKDNPDQPDPAPTPAFQEEPATTALAPARSESSAATSYE